MNDETVFAAAVKRPLEHRADFVREACQGDSDQHGRIMSLLSAHEDGGGLLDTEAMTVDTQVDHGVPKEIGDFVVGQLLGRGGMGVVYEAKQKSLNRTVALKLLSSGLGLSSRAILRFRREAEAAGKLHHTNIVPIYTTGEEGGVHFYAMELIDGPSLDQVIGGFKQHATSPALRGGGRALRPGWGFLNTASSNPSSSQRTGDAAPSPLPAATASDLPRKPGEVTPSASTTTGTAHFDNIATMFAEVAQALDHAHEHGVIHRDIKPSNLLLGPDGRLSVNDFGLARVLEQPGMTMTGEFVGSPLYMSPEQIAAGRTPIDHRTDIYSLGATLYEMLTLQPPFPGDSRDQVLTGILHKDPPSPRKFDRKIPVDLDTIVMKAIEKDPDKRYPTAGKLAEDLHAHVNRHAISARRMGPIGKTIKFIRRNPSLAALALTICIMASGGGLWLLDRQEQQRIEAVEQQEALKSDIVELAMSGRFDEAQEKLDSDGGILREPDRNLLQGQIFMYSDRLIDARTLFEQASASPTNATAARSLLAISCFLSGDEDGYLTKLKSVSELPANNYMDRLFKGYALHWFARDQAIELLTAAESESNSVHHAAQVMLAEAKLVYAMGEPNRKLGLRYAKEAKVKLDFVSEYWDDSPGLRQHRMNAELVLALVYDDLGNQSECQTCLDRAKTIASEELKRNAFDDEKSALPLMNYCMIAGEEDEMIQLVRDRMAAGWKSGGYKTHGYFEVMMPSLFYDRGNLKLAQAIHGQAPVRLQTLTAYVPAFLAMDSGNADCGAIRRELLRNLDERLNDPYTGVYAELDWVALRMLNADEAVLRKVADRVYYAYDTFFIGEDRKRGVMLAKYMQGRASAADVQRITCTERGIATYGYLTLAVDKIAEGDRVAAEQLLKQAVDEGYYQYYAHKWSRAFLRRIDDPSWLRWLPPVTEASHE